MILENCSNCKHYYFEWNDGFCCCERVKRFTITTDRVEVSSFVCDYFELGNEEKREIINDSGFRRVKEDE